MARECDITAEEARQLLDYNQDTGAFRWRHRSLGTFSNRRLGKVWNTRYAGQTITHKRANGYIFIIINNREYLAHRIAWLVSTGKLPVNQIDHVNGVRDDNRLMNLREATQSENNQNRSSVLGCQYLHGKWRGRIKINRKTICLGSFDTKEDAHSAYCAAKARLHTFNPNLR